MEKNHEKIAENSYREGITKMSFILLDAQITKQNFKDHCKIKVKKLNKTKGMILTNGNDAAGLGCVYAGATVCAWYPITPSTSIAGSFAILSFL